MCDASRSAFVDYYRCPDRLATVTTHERLSDSAGFFRFGDALAYGRCAGATPAKYATDSLSDVAPSVQFVHGVPRLPFDVSEVAGNLRQERYRHNGYSLLTRAASTEAAQRLYYAFRPVLGVQVRKHLQKLRLGGWENISFPEWPVDVSVERLMEGIMTLLVRAHGSVPFIWFWPDGARACAMMTHDVEGQTGLDFCDTLMDIDDAHAIKSAFQLVPGGREEAWRRTAARLRARGFEVNLHDWNHDGLLFSEREEFLDRVRRINQYAREFECQGFRSGAMYRDQSWFDAFEFSYDMSVPNVAHLEPQRGGCCTVMPYFVGHILELPLTTVQDYSLFHILGDYSTTLWKQQIEIIRRKHGLISVITHPDYLTGVAQRQVYMELLQHLAALRDPERLWIALPGDVNAWWRTRHGLSLVPDGDTWRIEGPGRERARLAYASLEHGRLTFALP